MRATRTAEFDELARAECEVTGQLAREVKPVPRLLEKNYLRLSSIEHCKGC